MGKRIKIRYMIWVALPLLFLGLASCTVQAGMTVFDSPYVSFSPDGGAWTTNAWDTDMQWYPEKMRIETGATSGLRKLQKGEHYYRTKKQGMATVGFWQVDWRAGQCIHEKHEDIFHQLSFGMKGCRRKHFSGWRGYCVDCREPVTDGFIYMNESAARSIRYIPLEMDYYYICPFCRNLEQGYRVSHLCKDISANRYRVIYEANFPLDGIGSGLTDISIHMYGNRTEYEGKRVVPQTRLSGNGYRCEGYYFVGWNTEADGTGTHYSDEAEISNLTEENWSGGFASDSPGTVVLYAQWQPAVGTLVLDPGEGKIRTGKGAIRLQGTGNSSLKIDRTRLIPPEGYLIHFDANGGSPVPDLRGTGHFVEWIREQPFQGSLEGELYTFPSIHGNVDTLRAGYEMDPVVLPEATRPGFIFGGWYYDKACTKPAGTELIPTGDITLYAGWVELCLQAEADYGPFHGEGAVNLQWNPLDTPVVGYRVYQRREGENWSPVSRTVEREELPKVSLSKGKTGREEVFLVPETGIYSLTLWGAQGGAYGSHAGGKGGRVTARLWLEQGEKLYYTIGGYEGSFGGGAASGFGNGGGCTTVWSDLKGLIAVAGGGGGASLMGDGGAGGSEASLREAGSEGEAGAAGGGAGYLGGRSGELLYHAHDKESCGYHQHVGDNKNGGICYQGKVNHVHTAACPRQLVSYCGGADWDGTMGWCPNCGVDESGGCTNIYAPGICVSYYLYRCDNAPYYQLTCLQKEGYYCGKTEQTVESSRPAYGGSSYLNTSVVMEGSKEAGVRAGDGGLELLSVRIGYRRECGVRGIYAPDREAPDPIAPETIRKLPAGDDTLVLSWKKPEDRGTLYYHYVEAQDGLEEKPVCTSNITGTTLCTGVLGYRLRVDDSPGTQIKPTDRFQKEGEIRLPLHQVGRYLHIATVDGAGNMSETVHVLIESKEVLWNIYTRQLELLVDGNVAGKSGEKAWYVRSDGDTPFYVTHGAVMEGKPEQDYQINEAVFRMTAQETARTGSVSVLVPFAVPPSAEGEVQGEALRYRTEGSFSLDRYPYTCVSRTRGGRELTTIQAFLPGKQLHGRTIRLVPEARAEYRTKDTTRLQTSGEAMDEANGLTLIFDGEGPKIKGLEGLRDNRLVDGLKDRLQLTLLAEDAISGLDVFTLQICNRDNGLRKEWHSTEGRIELELSKREPLYSGNFDVICIATDRVGNVSEESVSITEFELEARIERALQPHEDAFRRGESGWLHIRVRGYAERVQVLFPEEWTTPESTLNRTFDYSNELLYEQEETLRFMVPLHIPDNREYRVVVRAYKKGAVLEEQPTVMTIQVSGSILQELRTRLR